MQDIKISLVTVSFNAENTIERCIQSVIGQSYKNIEYIIIDGASTDKTIQLINKYDKNVSHFLSEPDMGIYDAMNKGIKFATGDVIGTLNADDFFADSEVLAHIAKVFNETGTQILYGDLDYINSVGKILRKWRSGEYKWGKFNWGWMPPHPTFYCKKGLFYQYGFYSFDYGTAADYELMLRFLHNNQIGAYYLEQVLVKMEIGGESNKSFGNRVKGAQNDFKAMCRNGIRMPLLTLIFKPLRKITQYFVYPDVNKCC